LTLWCATGNPGKLREFRLAAQRFRSPLRLEMFPEYGRIEPCEETGATFRENAELKAAYYGPHAPGLLFADDSGLEVEALGGEPGVYSARYAGAGATDDGNNRHLLERLHGIPNRTARFVCVIALARGSQVLQTFRGTVEGRLLEEPRGTEGFGYDPLFYYEPFGCTFGEVSPGRKLVVSHRGQALQAMLDYLRRIEEA
jgi:XTP/dITP diphosphohydrolase